MKVLHVIPSYEPAWAFGGTVTATSQLCRALAKQGIDVTVYTTDADGKGGHLDVPLNEPVSLGGVKVFYFHCDFGVRTAFYSRGLSRKLMEAIKKFNLVDVSAIWQWIQVDVYKACEHFSKPYIVTPHGSFSPWRWHRHILKKRSYWHFFGKKTIESAAAVHFTTEDERLNSFSSVPILQEISSFVVSNGIELKQIRKKKSIRPRLGISEDRFVLLFLGRIHRMKGIDLILEALDKLNNERFLFLIVGHKEDVSYVKYLTELSNKLKGRVFWHDPVSGDEVWDFYYSSNLFVLPSYDENFGMVVVEAMACGLPVMITQNVGIWREIQSDCVGVVVNRDAGEIAETLKKLADDADLLTRMKKNARKSAENRFDLDKVSSLMVKAYEDVLSGRRTQELQWK